MVSSKRLIVTADDVGLHEAMTLGAIRTHREGVVTACSVVANGRAFDHAITHLKENPGLEVGAHLCFVEELPLLPPSRVRSLIDAKNHFHRDHRQFAWRHALKRIDLRELESELRAQLERLISTGVRVTHLNSHQHLHAFPAIFDVFQKLAAEYGIGYIRRPIDRPRGSLARRWSIAALSRLAKRASTGSRAGGNENTIGVSRAGHLDVEHLVDLLGEAGNATELVAHPGVDDAALRSAYAWGYEWERETAALCSPILREAIAARGIRLVRPSEIIA